jgi:hypothetical protein
MKIIIESIPHETQRYTTVGDWFYDPDGTLHIKVSSLSDPRREFLVGIHEAIECELCRQEGVTQEVVDKFDMEYEKNRAENNEDEPGDDPSAPYHVQHCTATGIERILAAALGVDWKPYEQELTDLPEVPPHTP